MTKDISEGEGFFSMLEEGNQVLDLIPVAMELAGVQSGQATAAEVEEISEQLQQVEQSIGVVPGDLGRTADAGPQPAVQPDRTRNGPGPLGGRKRRGHPALGG